MVDDYSTDATGEVVSRFAEEHSNVHLVKNEGPRGFSNALKVGYEVVGTGETVTVRLFYTGRRLQKYRRYGGGARRASLSSAY